VKLYFPKYIDKVVIIEIKQTCHTVWLHWEHIVIQFGYTGRILSYNLVTLGGYCHTVWLHWEDIVIQCGYTGRILSYSLVTLGG
jgi:hypothetical protein